MKQGTSAAAVAIAVAVLAAGCGGESEVPAEEAAAPTEIAVAADEYSY